ncbi:MAG: NAD(P)-dependent oxidoreductase [Wenzhouxiangellaceae bacterium]
MPEKTLITGSAGHLGEALMRSLRAQGRDARGVDIKPSPFTDRVGSIVDRHFVRESMAGVDAVLHTATLHKPHVATHSRQDFVDTNISGTLNLLEEALAAGAGSFIFTSTTRHARPSTGRRRDPRILPRAPSNTTW